LQIQALSLFNGADFSKKTGRATSLHDGFRNKPKRDTVCPTPVGYLVQNKQPPNQHTKRESYPFEFDLVRLEYVIFSFINSTSTLFSIFD